MIESDWPRVQRRKHVPDPVVSTLVHHDELSRKDIAGENRGDAACETFGPVTRGDGDGNLGRRSSRHG
jgi:hypothetical protein